MDEATEFIGQRATRRLVALTRAQALNLLEYSCLEVADSSPAVTDNEALANSHDNASVSSTRWWERWPFLFPLPFPLSLEAALFCLGLDLGLPSSASTFLSTQATNSLYLFIRAFPFFSVSNLRSCFRGILHHCLHKMLPLLKAKEGAQGGGGYAGWHQTPNILLKLVVF